jgi:hypothetical protein
MNSEIVLDGVADESFWSEDPWFREARIPVANSDHDELFIKIIFAQNSTHLFIYVLWEDVAVGGSDTARYSAADGFAIMWNTNSSLDLPEDYFSGMKTTEPGHVVDNWVWKADAGAATDATGLNTTAGEKALIGGNTLDTAFGNTGWDDDLDTSQDVMAAATWGSQSSRDSHHYLLEMARPLITDDPSDVQFDKIGNYEFEIAIYNETSAGSHLISFEHSVFVYGVCTTDCDVPVVVTEYYPTEVEVSVPYNVTVTDTTTESSTPFAILPLVFTFIFFGFIATQIRRRK